MTDMSAETEGECRHYEFIMRKGLTLLYVHHTSHFSTCLTLPPRKELSRMKGKSNISQYVVILAKNTNIGQ
jgi:hypothetical protein